MAILGAVAVPVTFALVLQQLKVVEVVLNPSFTDDNDVTTEGLHGVVNDPELQDENPLLPQLARTQ
jgi:hypothetical protein